MAGVPFKKELFISSCLSSPPWVDDMMRRVREEQEQQFMKDLFKVPVFKVNAENYEIDYFKQPWITYGNYMKPNCIVKIEKENNKMEAKKCDRCGKLYETEIAREMVDIFFKHEKVSDVDKERYSDFYNAEKRTHEVTVRRGCCGDIIDLCPDCRKAFKKWFEEG